MQVSNYAEDNVYASELDEDPEYLAQNLVPADTREEQDGIECVLGHSRDEEKSTFPLLFLTLALTSYCAEGEAEDIPIENIVCISTHSCEPISCCLSAVPYQMEKLFPSPQYGRDLRVLEALQGSESHRQLHQERLGSREGYPRQPSRESRGTLGIPEPRWKRNNKLKLSKRSNRAGHLLT